MFPRRLDRAARAIIRNPKPGPLSYGPRPPYPAMLATVSLCLVLVVATTLLHYEVLSQLSSALPRVAIASRLKLVVVVLSAFAAHATQIALYALGIWAGIRFFGAGDLSGSGGSGILACLYFSGETYTSLGFGDVVPTGALRLLAGVETLNGLLLIGWSASYTYIAMERFWEDGAGARRAVAGAAVRK